MNVEPIVAPNASSPLPSHWNRRKWFASLVASVAIGRVLAGANNSSLWGAESSKGAKKIPAFRIRSVLELQGEVRLKNQGSVPERRHGKQLIARTVPVQSTTTLDYDEQYQRDGEAEDASVQYFHEATAETRVDANVTKTELRESCREIVKRSLASGIVSASPNQPLFAAERDLVEDCLTTMYLDELVTSGQVSIGDKWNIDGNATAKLLNLDAVHEGKLTVCLVKADKEQAQLTIEGQLTGTVRSVATELAIEGKATLDRRGGYISWLALQTNETREIGEAEPGFKVTATLRVLRAPIEAMSHGRTLDQAMKEVPSWESASMLQFQSDRGFYRFLADRRWMTYRDNGEEATLRLIVANRRVAQCNIANLIDFEPGRQLSLEGFQSDVRHLISAGGYEILEASERLSSTKHRLLRVVVAGHTEGVPIRWLYYHISNDTGRRLTMTFMFDEASLETFGEQDQQLTGTIELLAWPKKLDLEELKDDKDRVTTESASAAPKTTSR